MYRTWSPRAGPAGLPWLGPFPQGKVVGRPFLSAISTAFRVSCLRQLSTIFLRMRDNSEKPGTSTVRHRTVFVRFSAEKSGFEPHFSEGYEYILYVGTAFTEGARKICGHGMRFSKMPPISLTQREQVEENRKSF
jgi:hypothetical protein